MTDIRLINIILPTPAGAVQPTATPQNGSGQNASLLSTLTPGSVLAGYIVNRDAGGNPVLRTPQGDVTFASDFFLKIGSEVTLRIQQQAGQTLAKLLSVNGQPPAVGQAQSLLDAQPEVLVGGRLAQPQSQATQNIASQPASPGAPVFTLSGKVVAPPPGSNLPPPQLPAGTELRFKLLGLESAPAATVPRPPSPTETQAASPYYSVYQKPAATGQADISARAATEFKEPGQAISPPAATAVAGQRIAATVVAQQAGAPPLLQTPLGLVRLDHYPLPTQSSHVTLEVMETLTPQALSAATGALPLPHAPLGELALRWQSVQDIFTLLLSRPAAPAADALPKLLPASEVFSLLLNPARQTATPDLPPQSWASHAAFYAAALKKGDLREWLGRPLVQWLEANGQEKLLQKMEGEFAQLSRLYNGSQPGGWQALFYPLAAYGEVPMLRFFTKREKPPSSKQAAKPSPQETRFVVELQLSQLGELQLDGFVRRAQKQLQFDMAIRSHTPLPEDMQKEILAIYTRTGEATGYLGQIVFQPVKEFPVNPMHEIALSSTGMLA